MMKTETSMDQRHDEAFEATCMLDTPHDWIGYQWTVVAEDGSTLGEACDTAWAIAHIADRDGRTDYAAIAAKLLSATKRFSGSHQRYYGALGAVCLTPND